MFQKTIPITSMTDKTIRHVFFLVSTLLLFVTACSYNKGTEPVPVKKDVSYKLDVKPILVTHCYTCHADTATNPDRPGSPVFTDFAQLQHEALTPSNVNTNYTILIARLKHIESPGMPYNRDPLPDSLIQVIQDWVLVGAPEN